MTAYLVIADDTHPYKVPGGKPELYAVEKDDIIIVNDSIFFGNILWRHSAIHGWFLSDDLRPVTALLPGDKQREKSILRLLEIRKNAMAIQRGADETLEILGYKAIRDEPTTE